MNQIDETRELEYFESISALSMNPNLKPTNLFPVFKKDVCTDRMDYKKWCTARKRSAGSRIKYEAYHYERWKDGARSNS